MSKRLPMRRLRAALALLITLMVGLSTAGGGRADNPNERVIEPKVNVLDKDEINVPDGKLWVMHFVFKDPRVITVDIPGRGRRVCWYLPYFVVNKTKEAHTFIPDLELVADDKDTVHMDQILPTAQEAIRKLEDPTDYLKIKNSVQMAATPIPPSKENADPTRVAGVAIWDDVDPQTSHFYIYVSGLSNGWSVTDSTDPNDKDPVVRRKTLRLEFSRKGDPALLDSRQIKYGRRRQAPRSRERSEAGVERRADERRAFAGRAAAATGQARETKSSGDRTRSTRSAAADQETIDPAPRKLTWLIRKVKARSATAASRKASAWASSSTAVKASAPEASSSASAALTSTPAATSDAARTTPSSLWPTASSSSTGKAHASTSSPRNWRRSEAACIPECTKRGAGEEPAPFCVLGPTRRESPARS
jgi:hypothetical protein